MTFIRLLQQRFEMPMNLMWQRGLSFTALPLDGFKALSAHCHHLLSDVALNTRLRNSTFHLAVVDLIYNECGLALAHNLGEFRQYIYIYIYIQGWPRGP